MYLILQILQKNRFFRVAIEKWIVLNEYKIKLIRDKKWTASSNFFAYFYMYIKTEFYLYLK